MKSIRFSLTVGILFIAAAILVGGGHIFDNWKFNHANAFGTPPVSTHQQINTNKPLIQGKPVRIQIPSLKIDLTVIDGYYYPKSKTWTLSPDKAQYATMTPYANNREGNTFIYGHAVGAVFQNLPRITPGSEAIVYTENGHKFTYKLTLTYTTNPNDNSLFTYQGPPILTLQTCTGLWYQNRSMFVFSLEKVV